VVKILELFDGLKVKVHSSGKIETLDRKTIRKNGRIDNRRGRILRPSIDKYGYEQVVLTKNGVRKTYTVHRLVAMAFIDNPMNKPTVNHKDGNKRNNDYKNLEWATHKEQRKHSIKMGLSEKNIKALHVANNRKSIPVSFRGKEYPSIRSAARENNVHERVVRREGVVL
jgi:hypothetical protein